VHSLILRLVPPLQLSEEEEEEEEEAEEQQPT